MCQFCLNCAELRGSEANFLEADDVGKLVVSLQQSEEAPQPGSIPEVDGEKPGCGSKLILWMKRKRVWIVILTFASFVGASGMGAGVRFRSRARLRLDSLLHKLVKSQIGFGLAELPNLE